MGAIRVILRSQGRPGEATDQGHFDLSGLNGEIHATGDFVNLQPPW